MKNYDPTDDYDYDMEIEAADSVSSYIVLGCLLALILFAAFGFGCVLYFLFWMK